MVLDLATISWLCNKDTGNNKNKLNFIKIKKQTIFFISKNTSKKKTNHRIEENTCKLQI